MNKLLIALSLVSSFAFADSPAMATAGAPAAKGASCESKAVGKDGKPLAGAAKTSFLKKCHADAAAK